MGVSPNDWSNCAEFFYNAGRVEKAVEILEQYFKNFDRYVTKYKSYTTAPMKLYTKILIEKGEYIKAYEWVKKAYDNNYRVPADVSIYIKTIALNGNLDIALTEYKKYIDEIHGGFEEFKEAQELKQFILNISLEK